jgi:UDP-N-acetylmuramyl pentapeptide phosphotransferase/UDP-N-acetylglucosamine-1-phosphate transferase
MQDSFLFSFAMIAISLLLSLIFTQKVRGILLQRSLLDIPNDRSSHKTPVPRGGGWGILAVLIPALIGAMLFIDNDIHHAGLVLAVLLLAGISWLDDSHHVSAAKRLSMHILAACLGSFSFSAHDTIFSGLLPFWLDRTIMILGWAWFINLYNFMDGIDGITGTETISIATGVCLVMAAASISDPFISFISLIVTGVCLGFLAHNWHPAKIFLGDIGSVPLGFLMGFFLLFLAIKGHLVAALILPLYYLADSGITIAKRALQGKKIWQAHREHFYQYAALRIGKHDKVVIMILIGNVGLIGAAMVSVSRPIEGIGAGVIIVALLLIKMKNTKSKTLTVVQK